MTSIYVGGVTHNKITLLCKIAHAQCMPVPRVQLAVTSVTIDAVTMEDVDEDPMVEVLFKYKGSRKALIFQVSAVCDCVEQELQDLGVNEPTVSLSAGLAKPDNEIQTVSFSKNGVANGGGGVYQCGECS